VPAGLKSGGALIASMSLGSRRIFKYGEISGIGPRRNIVPSIGMNLCRQTAAPVADRGWKRRFEDPIPLPRSRRLVTLQDAGNYITRLPKAEHETQEWQAAMEALILVATLGGPTMFARIGVIRALNRGHVREFDASRKNTHWGKRKLKRDL
jgi:hypothetical protein